MRDRRTPNCGLWSPKSAVASIVAACEIEGVDNPARTAEFLVHRDARRAALRGDLQQALGGRTSLTFEVGCGHGHFLTDFAKAHPETFCLGIDLIRDRIQRAGRKRDRAGVQNLVFLSAEAEECVAALPEGCELERIFILFPDPWPKRRHHKHRIMQPEFLAALAARTRPGASLCFRTDDASYFTAARAVVLEHPDWELAGAAWPFERETVFQSRAAIYQSLVATRRPR